MTKKVTKWYFSDNYKDHYVQFIEEGQLKYSKIWTSYYERFDNGELELSYYVIGRHKMSSSEVVRLGRKVDENIRLKADNYSLRSKLKYTSASSVFHQKTLAIARSKHCSNLAKSRSENWRQLNKIVESPILALTSPDRKTRELVELMLKFKGIEDET